MVLTSVSTDEKDKDGHAVVLFNQPLKCVCLENDSAAKINKSFIVGGATGQVIYHRTVWFAQKNVSLFTGADSPVSAISWRGNIVAWADSSQVRLMDVTTQTAICYLCCPEGVGPHHTLLPCSLFWESDCDLLVGWGDSFRHVELVATTLPGGDSGMSNNTPLTHPFLTLSHLLPLSHTSLSLTPPSLSHLPPSHTPLSLTPSSSLSPVTPTIRRR